MRLAFLDESGKAADPVSVVAGVVIDGYRFNATRREWSAMLVQLSMLAGEPLHEFHMRNAYSGRNEWKHAGIENRSDAINQVLGWMAAKGHRIVFSATLRSAFEERVASGCPLTQTLGSRWVAEAFHVALAINKEHRGLLNNKGNTMLIFDEGSGFERRVSELLVSPPEWSDDYYGRKKKEAQLKEIIDTSLFADSSHAPLIQVADTTAFILRRLAEIRDVGQPERFAGECANLETWVQTISPAIQSAAHRYKKVGRTACADLFWQLAPPSLRSIA